MEVCSVITLRIENCFSETLSSIRERCSIFSSWQHDPHTIFSLPEESELKSFKAGERWCQSQCFVFTDKETETQRDQGIWKNHMAGFFLPDQSFSLSLSLPLLTPPSLPPLPAISLLQPPPPCEVITCMIPDLH